MGVATEDRGDPGQAVGEVDEVARRVEQVGAVAAEVPDRDEGADVALSRELRDLGVDGRRRVGDLERVEVAGEDQRRQLGQRVADHAELEPVEAERPRGLPLGRQLAVRLEDGVRAEVRERCQRDQLVPQVRRPVVEVVVAEGVGRHPQHVEDLDRRLVAEEVRDRRRGADRVATGHRDVVAAVEAAQRLGAVRVEPRLEVRGAADAERRADRVGRLRQRDQLAVEVADVEDRGLLPAARAREQLVEDLAAGVRRAGDPHEEGDGRGQVDRADAVDRALLADARAGRHERGVHVHAARQVDGLRQVAVLAEELAEGDRLAEGRRVELVRRLEHDDDVAAAVRVERVAPVDVPQLLLLHDPEHDLRAGVGRVGKGGEGVDDPGPDLLVGRPGRQRRVDVDLRGAAGPAGLREVERAGATRTAVAEHLAGRGAVVLQARVVEDLARVDGKPLGPEPVVRARDRRRAAAHELAPEGERLVGLHVGGAQDAIGLGRRDELAVRGVVVVVRVRDAVHLGRREPEEHVRELVGDRVAEHQQVGLVAQPGDRAAADGRDAGRAEDVAEVRVVRVLPHQALLDVGRGVDEAGLEDRVVGGRRARERRVQRLLERGRSRGPEGVVRRDRPGDRGEEDAELREVRREDHRLHVEAAGLAGRVRQRDLDVGPLVLAQVRDGLAAVLRERVGDDENAVVVGVASFVES